MRIRAWRITQSAFAASAFDGEGARRFGGRWNSSGTPLVYTAESQSLAVLEMIVHLVPGAADHYVVIPVKFDPKLVDILPPAELPVDWMDEPPPLSTQSIGDRWTARKGNVALKVPSKIVRNEHLYLLNPHHPAFVGVRIGKPEKFVLDPRVIRRLRS